MAWSASVDGATKLARALSKKDSVLKSSVSSTCAAGNAAMTSDWDAPFSSIAKAWSVMKSMLFEFLFIGVVSDVVCFHELAQRPQSAGL